MYMIFDAFTIFTVVYFIALVFIGAFFLLNLTLAVIKAKFTDNDHNVIKETNGDELNFEEDEFEDE